MSIAPPNPPAIWARDENVGGPQDDPTLIVMHATVSSDNAGTARNIAQRWHDVVTQTSAHYLRDAKECIQAVGDHRVAYHCGYNIGSVAYEMCDEQTGPASRWTDADSTAIIDGSARDVARLGLAYGIPLRRLTNDQLRYWAANGKQAKHGGIVSHEQMSVVFRKSTHTDPRDFPWTSFMAKVKKEADALTAPPPPPVTTHTRWAIRETGVHVVPGGERLRNIPAGYKFQVVDGSGAGMNGWIETTHGNWVLGKDTTTRDPALPSRLSVLTHNVWNGRDWEDDVLPTINAILTKYQPHVSGFQECYKAPDLTGKVPGYAYRYQGFGFEPEHEGWIEEHSNNVILVRDGVEVKAREAYEMTLAWRGPKLGIMHEPRIHRRVTVRNDEQNFRVINVHGPFGAEPKAETLYRIKTEIEALAELGDPVIAIGDWNVDFETLVAAMGPNITVDGRGPDMVAYVNCRKVSSVNLGRQGSDTHDCKIWTFEA